MIKKLIGSVLNVFKAHGYAKNIVDDFAKNRGRDENQEVITRDVPRTALVDFSGKIFDDFYNEVHEESVYKEHYIQGNLDGGTALDIYDIYKGAKVKALYEEVDKLPASPEKTAKSEYATKFFIDWTKNRESLRFAYRDDQGKLCYVGLVFNKKEPHNWALQIGKNTIAPLSQREAFLFAQGEMVSSEQASEIDPSALAQEMTIALGSEKVSALLSGLINEKGEIVLEKFEELNKRITSNKNIDNRDFKKRQLEELMIQAKQLLPNDVVLQEYYDHINLRSSDDIDFFKEGNFEDALNELFVKISTQLEQIEDEEQAKTALVDTKLTYYAIQAELKAFPLYSKSEHVLADAYMDEAKKLRELRDNPLSKKDAYQDMFFSQLNKQITERAAKLIKIEQFIQNTKQKCGGDAEAIAYVKELESGLKKDIDSYTDKRLDLALDICAQKFEVHLRQRALIVHDKVMDLASQLESYAGTVEDEEIRKGILDRAKKLTELPENEMLRYKNLDFEEVRDDVVAELGRVQFKKKFLADLNSFADTLPANSPAFLKQRIKDKVVDLQEIGHDRFAKLYQDKDFKTAAAELVNQLFINEKSKKQTEIKTDLRNQIDQAKPKAPEVQGFFQRNRNSLIIGGLAVLAFISLVLTLTGVLAPLGIALGGATAITAALAATAVAGATIVGAGTQVMNNEAQFSDDKEDYLERVKRHKEKDASFEADYAKAVQVHKESFDKMHSEFMNAYFGDERNDMNVDLPIGEPVVGLEPPILELEKDVDKLLQKIEDQLITGEEEITKGFGKVVRPPVAITPEIPSKGKEGMKVGQVEEELDETTSVPTLVKQ
jgi:hypothetical protein